MRKPHHETIKNNNKRSQGGDDTKMPIGAG